MSTLFQEYSISLVRVVVVMKLFDVVMKLFDVKRREEEKTFSLCCVSVADKKLLFSF